MLSRRRMQQADGQDRLCHAQAVPTDRCPSKVHQLLPGVLPFAGLHVHGLTVLVAKDTCITSKAWVKLRVAAVFCSRTDHNCITASRRPAYTTCNSGDLAVPVSFQQLPIPASACLYRAVLDAHKDAYSTPDVVSLLFPQLSMSNMHSTVASIPAAMLIMYMHDPTGTTCMNQQKNSMHEWGMGHSYTLLTPQQDRVTA